MATTKNHMLKFYILKLNVCFDLVMINGNAFDADNFPKDNESSLGTGGLCLAEKKFMKMEPEINDQYPNRGMLRSMTG